jgi:hypothetical protein
VPHLLEKLHFHRLLGLIATAFLTLHYGLQLLVLLVLLVLYQLIWLSPGGHSGTILLFDATHDASRGLRIDKKLRMVMVLIPENIDFLLPRCSSRHVRSNEVATHLDKKGGVDRIRTEEKRNTKPDRSVRAAKK